MRIEDWEACESLFHRARELPEKDRTAFLDQNCAPGKMRRVVDSLLRYDEGVDDFLIPAATATIATDFSLSTPEEIDAPLIAGTNLGPYRLVRFLGSGACGEVWEAEDASTGRRIALKVLARLRMVEDEPAGEGENQPGGPNSRLPIQLMSFYHEGRLAARINHPRSVYVFGAEEIQGLPIITMELMTGGTLEDKLRVHGKLGVYEAVDFILDVIEGLEAAQRVGIVHRDIKPSNCFVDEEGRARIGDFGIAMALQPGSSSSGGFAGTPAYASPEQVRGRDVDARSDIYSVGATLYTLLTGKRPFEGRHPGEILSRILSEPPIPITNHGVRIPRGLARVIERCLAKEREKRYPSYSALRKDLLPYSSTAVTPGKLASRLAAFIVDEFVVMVGMFAAAQTLLSGWPAEIAVTFMHFLYYGFFEIVWGRTPGKYLMGLSIVDASGVAMNQRQAAIRAVVFGSVLLPLIVTERFVGPALLMRVATVVAYLVTMRRENGFAGPHDLISHTRVIASKRGEIALSESVTSEVPDQTVVGPRAKFGPFETLSEVWRKDNESLVLAFEPVLRRNVWIHISESSHAKKSDRLASVRPGKLRWLQGGRQGIHWDAFEVARGESLWDRIRNRGCLPWAQVRSMLLNVTAELEARIASGEKPLLSLQHIWINPVRRSNDVAVKVLEFPAAIPDGSLNRVRIDADNAKDFIYEVLVFALTGSVPQRSNGGNLSVPLPEHARAFASRLSNRYDTISISALHHDLQRLNSQPAEVRRSRRAAMLAVAASVPLALVVSHAAAPMIDALRLPLWQRELKRVPVYDMWANRLEDSRTPEARVASTSICKMLAWIGTQASEAPGGRHMLSGLRPFEKDRLEKCRSQYRSVTASEAMEARKAAEDYFIGRSLSSAEKDRQFAVLRQGIDLLFWAGGVLWIIPVALSLMFPPGICGRLLGVGLETTRGQPAGAMRRALRSVCAWFPFVLFYPMMAATAYFGYAPNAASYWQKEGFLAATAQLHGYSAVLGIVVAILLGLFGLGIIFALAKPDRGLPDFIAGTCLVPK
jgi:eukaryotic-like serine/threonine-protein kinase